MSEKIQIHPLDGTFVFNDRIYNMADIMDRQFFVDDVNEHILTDKKVEEIDANGYDMGYEGGYDSGRSEGEESKEEEMQIEIDTLNDEINTLNERIAELEGEVSGLVNGTP